MYSLKKLLYNIHVILTYAQITHVFLANYLYFTPIIELKKHVSIPFINPHM